mmetsp:Transcript_84258/g.171883  ORF Transcript_84258/g.171883 Transcript_84258/m.171883 type:complete len:86 (-) Transcript_84258:762-1019(-)
MDTCNSYVAGTGIVLEHAVCQKKDPVHATSLLLTHGARVQTTWSHILSMLGRGFTSVRSRNLGDKGNSSSLTLESFMAAQLNLWR